MTENITSLVYAGVTYKFDAKMAHLGSVLADAIDDKAKLMAKLVENGILDSESNARFRETMAQSRFDALEEKSSLVTLAGEVFALAKKLQDVETDIKTTRGNFRVDVSALDYDASKADIVNVTRWAEMLKLALDVAKAKAETSLNAPDENGATKLSMLAGYNSAYTGKYNALREALDKLGFNTHNLLADGKLVSRPSSVQPAKAKGAHKTGGKHGVSITDKDGNKREFANKLEAAQVLTTEGAVPAGSFNEYQLTIYTPTDKFWAILAASGLRAA